MVDAVSITQYNPAKVAYRFQSLEKRYKMTYVYHLGRDAKILAAKAGLPTYKCVVPIRKRADRDKLDAKACPECQAVSMTKTCFLIIE